MESSFVAADSGTTSSGDCGTTSGDRGADSKGDTGGDCGADLGKDCGDTEPHPTEREYKYTDFAAVPQTDTAGPSISSQSKTQPDTSTPEELQLQEERKQARIQKKEKRKEQTKKFLNSAKAIAENIIKGKF